MKLLHAKLPTGDAIVFDIDKIQCAYQSPSQNKTAIVLVSGDTFIVDEPYDSIITRLEAS